MKRFLLCLQSVPVRSGARAIRASNISNPHVAMSISIGARTTAFVCPRNTKIKLPGRRSVLVCFHYSCYLLVIENSRSGKVAPSWSLFVVLLLLWRRGTLPEAFVSINLVAIRPRQFCVLLSKSLPPSSSLRLTKSVEFALNTPTEAGRKPLGDWRCRYPRFDCPQQSSSSESCPGCSY